MVDKAKVVIVGGGISGASISYNLAKRGLADVLIIEREKFNAAQATGKCAGGVRAQFSSDINCRMSLLSERIFENLGGELGADIAFNQKGYLFVCATEQELENQRKANEVQKAAGVDTVQFLTPGEIAARWPVIRTDDLIGGAFNPRDGFVDPHEVTMGYINAGRRLGVRQLLETEITGIKKKGSKISGVETTAGDIECEILINGAGAWCAEIGRMAGVEIPAKPFRRVLYITTPMKVIPDDLPMVVDNHTGAYMRRESGGIEFGRANWNEPSSFNQNPDMEYLEEILPFFINRLPFMEDADLADAWAGLYSITPDHHAILGRVPEVENFYLACGYSGHGLMHGPAVGQLIAELIVEGEYKTIDASVLALMRFKEGREIHEVAVI
jgi:sarcosine oxidase subunit beta